MAKAIFLGDGNVALDATQRALDDGISIQDIVIKAVLKAWVDFSEWHKRDPNGALKRWFDCYTTTNRVLKVLDSKIAPIPNPPFATLLITIRGEGHVLIKDTIATLLKAEGLKVYNLPKGVLIDDISKYLTDPSLKFVIISCTQKETKEAINDLIEMIKRTRSDLKIVAGGPIAEGISADIVISNPSELFKTLNLR
ncbi:MAG: cobalamin B12-binding domain-containing protein [Candidatus Methylarchaceae archaeon HK02M2]|nr:cobalamin B12-binding domain-containing protein [Candidatus Methylarchaceae archaeon HK02M2]